MAVANTKKKLTKKLEKSKTGISGFDEISDGGIPKNRPTVVCGSAGAGKTILAIEFLVKGALLYNEPGVFLSFEETSEELINNMLALNFDLDKLIKNKTLYIEYLDMSKTDNIETGDYNLEGLFVRLKQAVKNVGAKRLVLDSVDALFYGVKSSILRKEIVRLFRWLKEHNVTAVVTAEMHNNLVNTYGLKEYIADCVILLDTRVDNQITTRRLRISKMRGSSHGINEYPFIIDDNGLSVLPIISELTNHSLSKNRITTGIKDLDDMLDGKGYFQGSSILISGSAGTGKTSIASAFVKAVCVKKIKSLYCAFEESTSQIIRNMNSIGFNLEPYLKSNILHFYSSRPTLQNLELHLIAIKKVIETHKPEIIVLDPITNLMSEGINSEIRQMLTHFVDFLKAKDITTLFTAAITLETIKSNPSDEGISSMVDTWILLSDREQHRERNRGIYVLKSRGMNHSTQVREFVISNDGISLLPIYIGPEGILTGSAKLLNTLKEEELNKLQQKVMINERNEVERKRKIFESSKIQLSTVFESAMETFEQTIFQNSIVEESKKIKTAEITALRNNLKSSSEKSKPRNK